MKRRLIFIALASLLLFAASLGSAPTLGWYALTGGGGRDTSGIYALRSAIGQPFASLDTLRTTSLCAGFLCASQSELLLYLPVVRK